MTSKVVVDLITGAALSVHDPLITQIGLFINNDLLYAALVFAMILSAEGRNSKRMKVLLSLAIAISLGVLIKTALAEQRPCAGEAWCPTGYSFPSLHALAAFTMMIAFLNKKSYPAFLLFALFVAFTRLNIGVHIFRDIAGALPLAVIAYYITGLAWPLVEKKVGRALDG